MKHVVEQSRGRDFRTGARALVRIREIDQMEQKRLLGTQRWRNRARHQLMIEPMCHLCAARAGAVITGPFPVPSQRA